MVCSTGHIIWQDSGRTLRCPATRICSRAYLVSWVAASSSCTFSGSFQIACMAWAGGGRAGTSG